MVIKFRLHRSINLGSQTNLVFRSNNQSLDILEKTLKLLKLEFLIQGNMLTINKTNTKIELIRFANWTFINFKLYNNEDQKEKYLKTVLIKHLS